MAAAAGIVWLVSLQLTASGSRAVITFPRASGIAPGSAVTHKGVRVGSVERVELDEGWQQVQVHIRMDDDAGAYLRTGTRFWIPSSGGLGRMLPGFLGGTSIAIMPGDGEATERFQGMLESPARDPDEPGRKFLLHTQERGSLQIDSPVFCRGFRIGRVHALDFEPERQRVLVGVFIQERYAGHVHRNSRFWQLAGVRLKDGDGGKSLEVASPSVITGGGIAMKTPPALAGPVAEAGTEFRLHGSESAAQAVPIGPGFTYQAVFDQPVEGIARGAAVSVLGTQVGTISDVTLHFDEASLSFTTQIDLRLDPRRFGIDIDEATPRTDVQERLNQRLQVLVDAGLRAKLNGGVPVVGGAGIDLVMQENPEPAQLVLDREPPRLPTVGGVGGVAGILETVDGIATSLDQVPYAQIGRHVNSTVAGVDRIINSQRVTDILANTDAALADIEAVTQTAREEVRPALRELRHVVARMQSAAASIDNLLGGPTRQNQDLPSLIAELQQAAAAVRALASLLTRHPESLITGHGGG
ncbi:MAG: intermembrane transport protein PqiB [Planctomycetota bacterium]